MKKNLNNNIFIFNKYINNNYKSIPFNERYNSIGNTKYFPPVIKEWKNSIYAYNLSYIKNIPLYNLDINFLIKSYFNLYFEKNFLKFKEIRPNKNRRFAINNIFVSRAEIKHTNSKAIITVYTYNREKFVLLGKIRRWRELILKKIFILLYRGKFLYGNIYNNIYNKTIRALLYKELLLLRRLKLKLSLNKHKFEEIFLYKLSKLISKFYNKKVEFNIINLKSIVFNSDLFTRMLTLKLKDKKTNVIRMMNIILKKVVLPKVNRIKEKSTVIKSIDFNLVENKYKNLNINSIINNSLNNLDELFNELYYSVILKKNLKNSYSKIYEIIFNHIKYKNMGGVRLEVKGRLTKRYRADRAIFKVRWKGGLKNIDSSYKGLSSVNMRGYVKPNLEYSILTSKRRIGAFAVKGWISGK